MAQIKPDLAIAWPTTLDYPGFRLQLRQYRDHFAKVIIAFSNHNVFPDIHKWFPSWLEGAMAEDQVEFISWQEVEAYPAQDWAQRLSRCAWQHVTSPYMFWTQQDFLVHNPHLFQEMFDDHYQVVTHKSHYVHSNRYEPDCIFINMQLLRQTSMNVATSSRYDHWGELSLELSKLQPIYKTLEDLGFYTPQDWEHLSGCTSNYAAVMFKADNNFQGTNFHKHNRFVDYNRTILAELQKNSIPIHPYFAALVQRIAAINNE